MSEIAFDRDPVGDGLVEGDHDRHADADGQAGVVLVRRDVLDVEGLVSALTVEKVVVCLVRLARRRSTATVVTV